MLSIDYVHANYKHFNSCLENLFVFVIDTVFYGYNYCTSYFYKLGLYFIEDKDTGIIVKCFKIIERLNYSKQEKIIYYNYEKDPFDGVCISRNIKRLNFINV
jgi:hypothetical protein